MAETYASNPGGVRPQWGQYLRHEYPTFFVIAIFLLIVFGPLAYFFGSWWWLGTLLFPIAIGVMYYGMYRLMTQGDLCPAQVISLSPQRVVIWTDMSMHPQMTHPTIIVKDTELERLAGGPVEIGERLVVAAFYEGEEVDAEKGRWSRLSVVTPVRAATAHAQDLARTFNRLPAEVWEKLSAGYQKVGRPTEEGVFPLQEGLAPSVPQQGSPYWHDGKDPKMLKAGELGRKTFRFYLREWNWEQRRIIPGLEVAAVKVAFSDPPHLKNPDPKALNVEYMWINDITFDGKTLKGQLLNQPQSLRSVSEGDIIEVSPKQITDWMYSVQGTICGGFTVQVARMQMDEAQRQAFDDAWGIDFGDPGLVRVVPDSFLPPDVLSQNTALPGLEGMAIRGDFQRISALEHPMSVNMGESLADALRQNPGMLHSVGASGLPFMHDLVVGGSLNGVTTCLDHGADPNQKANNGMTPLMLAKLLGWKKLQECLTQAGARG